MQSSVFCISHGTPPEGVGAGCHGSLCESCVLNWNFRNAKFPARFSKIQISGNKDSRKSRFPEINMSGNPDPAHIQIHNACYVFEANPPRKITSVMFSNRYLIAKLSRSDAKPSSREPSIVVD